MSWQSIPFVRFTVAFILGILLYFSGANQVDYRVFIVLGVLLLGSYLVFYYLLNKSKNSHLKTVLGAIALFFILIFGVVYTHFNFQVNSKNHVKNYPSVEEFSGTVISEIEEKEKSFKAVVEVDKIRKGSSWVKAQGKVLVYFEKSASLNKIQYNDAIFFVKELSEVAPPQNPAQFDYKHYLEKQNIFNQVFLKKGEYKIVPNTDFSIIKSAIVLRQKMAVLLGKYIENSRERGIAIALVLGAKNELDEEIEAQYTNTGVVHVLAVSGLHVGMVYQVILGIFSFLKINRSRAGAFVQAGLLILLIWFYAFLTGLSPSVMRATAMFSFVIVGKAFKRNTNIYNTLAVSAFLLLLIDPQYIFQVSFQLSYLAVIGIVYFQPIIYGFLDFPYKFIDKFWTITSVTIAAQLITFPISIYYFGQFPTYFLITNIMTIPKATFILVGGLVKIALGSIDILNKYMGFVYEKLIWFTNQGVATMDGLPFAVIKNLHLSGFEMVCLYLLMVFLIWFSASKHIIHFTLATAFSVCFFVSKTANFIEEENQSQLVIYSTKNYSNIAVINGHSCDFYYSDTLTNDTKTMNFSILTHLRDLGINKINYINGFDTQHFKPTPFGSVGVWNGNKILIINSANALPKDLKIEQFDMVVLQNNARINEPVFAKAKKLLVDSSCSWWYAEKIKTAFGDKTHIISENGAFTLQL